ncbi:MAG: hypothetical protein PHD48_04085 [Alphaproteobacteria bacterium]|nr:hypothetical protein [Alphaproteobacteria bacterium]
MNEQIKEIVERIRLLEDRLEDEFQKSRDAYQVKIRGKMAEFAEEIVVRQRAFRVRMPQYFRTAGLLNVLVSPVIYSMIVPMALLDFWVTVYQQICFRAYGIPLVKRSTFILMDRHHLAYLNLIEKINCAYCGYGQGVFAYAREVAARTEQFWCPIKHALRVRDPHDRYVKFLEYGDAEGYLPGLEDLRKDVQNSGDA